MLYGRGLRVEVSGKIDRNFEQAMKVGVCEFYGIGIALPLRRDRSGRKFRRSGINDTLRMNYWLIIKTIKTGIGIATSLRSSQ